MLRVLHEGRAKNTSRQEASAPPGCALPSSFIRTMSLTETPVRRNRRLRLWTGSADLTIRRERSRAYPCGPTAGGDFHPALKTF